MLKHRLYLKFIVCIQFLLLSLCSSNKEFDDSVLFRLSWPGSLPDLTSLEGQDVIELTTLGNEKYQCRLPITVETENDRDQPYSGASALELLQPLFLQFSCSYKLEHYWTYELCHGRYLKQYHDDKDITNSKRLRKHEYVLGRFSTDKYIKAAAKLRQESTSDTKQEVPTKKFNSQNLPYYEIEMVDGTPCDVNEKPRTARILYICHPDSNNELYSIYEESSCEYEVIVLTPLLCAHSDYKMKETVEHDIKCHSLGESGTRPLQLEKIESENKKFAEKNAKAQEAYLKKHEKVVAEATKILRERAMRTEAPNDQKMMDDFLSGRHCLHGGTSWWKFEFCNWKKVVQYHEYEDKRRIEIVLGKWDKKKHLNWLEENPHKRPKKGLIPSQVSHMYADGNTCDLSGKPRQVEVKMKCKEIVNHPNAVSLYLLEPKPCEYILVVESSILCPLIEQTDEKGLFPEIPEVR